MYKIEHVFKRDAEERYQWIAQMISEEGSDNQEGKKKLYYYGSNYVYNNICGKLVKDFGTTNNMLMVTKDTVFDENCVIFTDDVMFEIGYLWPNTYNAMRKVKGLKWYVSILDKTRAEQHTSGEK